MKISKKELLLKVQQTLNEMPMTFDTDDSRPHQDVERDLANREHPLKKVNFPKNVDEPHSNFEEMLASKRYQQIVANVRQHMGLPLGVGERNIQTLYNTMMQGQSMIHRIESQHKTELEQLAIRLVMTQMGIEEGDIKYEATIELPSEEGFKNTPPGDMEPEEIEIEKELFDEFEDFTLELAKRRLINAMMQGASSKGHFFYHYVSNEIAEITGSEDLVRMYGAIMSAAEAMLWQGGNRSLGLSGGGGTPMAGGKERVFPNENPPRVVATAINFPILVHELLKGTLEVVAALHGQPKDKELAKRVLDKEDTKQKEIWDLRLGPAIWDMLRESFPEETITDEDKVGMQLIFFQRIVSKPAKEFLVFMKEALSNTETGKRLMSDLYNMINGEINDYDYKKAMQDFDDRLNGATDDTEDDDLKDFLGGMGIDLS
jgi:hypothetical protein